MREKLTLSQAVIVEGKYDKIHLEAVVDALILTTDGFRIFKDKEMRALIRRLANTCGIIILTDSDAAGFKIRAHISDIAREGRVTQVYIPDIPGKEKRKNRPGREGKLGVEGVDITLLRRALADAGVMPQAPAVQSGITRQELYACGLTGSAGSSRLRRELAVRLGMPQRLSTTALLQMLCRTLTLEELHVHIDQLMMENPGQPGGEG